MSVSPAGARVSTGYRAALGTSEPEPEVGVDREHVHLRLLQAARVVPVHRLPPGELVEDPPPRLPAAVAGAPVAAEGQVRLGARGGVVHADHPGAVAAPEPEH